MVPVSFSADSGAPLEFAGEEFVLTKDTKGSGALYWPRERALLVADLHLEKGSWYARTGQMLPPRVNFKRCRSLAGHKHECNRMNSAGAREFHTKVVLGVRAIRQGDS